MYDNRVLGQCYHNTVYHNCMNNIVLLTVCFVCNPKLSS